MNSLHLLTRAERTLLEALGALCLGEGGRCVLHLAP
jgi:hypothetical protein